VPGAGKAELASGSRQDRAQVRRPDFPLPEDAGPSRFGHRGLEHQIPAIALLHDRAARPLPKRQQQKQEFLNRIIPLVLANTRIGPWRDHAAYAEYRERRSSRLWSSTLRVLEKTTSGLYKAMRATAQRSR
jgi:hypothetical protein